MWNETILELAKFSNILICLCIHESPSYSLQIKKSEVFKLFHGLLLF